MIKHEETITDTQLIGGADADVYAHQQGGPVA